MSCGRVGSGRVMSLLALSTPDTFHSQHPSCPQVIGSRHLSTKKVSSIGYTKKSIYCGLHYSVSSTVSSCAHLIEYLVQGLLMILIRLKRMICDGRKQTNCQVVDPCCMTRLMI